MPVIKKNLKIIFFIVNGMQIGRIYDLGIGGKVLLYSHHI